MDHRTYCLHKNKTLCQKALEIWRGNACLRNANSLLSFRTKITVTLSCLFFSKLCIHLRAALCAMLSRIDPVWQWTAGQIQTIQELLHTEWTENTVFLAGWLVMSAHLLLIIQIQTQSSLCLINVYTACITAETWSNMHITCWDCISGAGQCPSVLLQCFSFTNCPH